MKILPFINKLLIHLKKPHDITKFNNLLVVSNTGLGDTLLSTPAIKSLRKSFPEQKIIFLVNKKMSTLFDKYQYVDKIILYSNGFLNLIRLVYKLRKLRIDTIFLFHSNGPQDVFFSILSGAPNILKRTHNKNHEFKSIFYNQPVDKIKHDIECKLDLIRIFKPTHIDTRMSFSNKNPTEEIVFPKNKKIIGLQIGAQDLYKIWPIKNFINLSNKLFQNNDIHIVIFGHTSYEQKIVKTYMKEFQNVSDKITNLCAKTTLEELCDAIKKIDILISNDTGTMHLAFASKIPTVCLFSPTDSKIFGPYQDLDKHIVIQKDGNFINNKPKKQRNQDAMKLITVEEVYENTLIQLTRINKCAK